MIHEVLEILTENLTNERLDNIVKKNINYQEIADRVHLALSELEKIGSNEKAVQRLIDNYDSATHRFQKNYITIR